MAAHRRILVVLLLASAQAAGCARSNTPALPAADDGDGDAAPTTSTATPDGLVSVSVTPQSVALTMAYADPATPAAQTFTATGTFRDGSVRDVTTSAAWSTSEPDAPVSADSGLFSTTAPGLFTVIANLGGISGSATARVKMTGDVTDPAAPANAQSELDATPSAPATAIAYPLDGALVPYAFGPLEIQVTQGSASQTLARLQVTGDAIDLRFYGPCVAIPGASSGCTLTLPPSMNAVLAGASTADVMSIQVRACASDGTLLGESPSIDVRWSFDGLAGALYYWRAIDHQADTAISRFDLGSPGAAPQDFFVNDPDSPPLPDGTQHPCVGCHAISQDGTKMALTFGGSVPSSWGLLDVATKTFIATENTDANGFATMTAFGPDGSRLLTAFRGAITLRSATASAAAVGPDPFASIGEPVTLPFWSQDGTEIAFVGWQPNQNGASSSNTGDLVRGGEIWLSGSDGQSATGTPRLLVPRVANQTETYPTLSDDSTWVAFVQTDCNGPATMGPYGNDPCDGYDDPSARLQLVAAGPGAGAAPIDLARANGSQTWTNSWPRFGPAHGAYHGRPLYWLAYSSRRPYGLVLPGSTDGSSPPQLWVAAVVLDGTSQPTVDPSFAPVWMPGQDPDVTAPTGNHVPQWVKTYVSTTIP